MVNTVTEHRLLDYTADSDFGSLWDDRLRSIIRLVDIDAEGHSHPWQMPNLLSTLSSRAFLSQRVEHHIPKVSVLVEELLSSPIDREREVRRPSTCDGRIST